MTNNYAPNEIEKRWIKEWQKTGLYKAENFSDKPKSYVLIEFPYPSGERLHVGHARSYSCLDAVARLRRMKGLNVMFPFGWDAFGLPAENYALKTGVHPAVTTRENISRSKEQAVSWGLSFDWGREINTTDPDYYKWTQWIFVQLFKKGLAYKEEIAVNWCPSCKINLANEEVINGKCERCGADTGRRMQSQWLLKITAYADRLLEDLKKVNFREDIAIQQENWIGKKEGTFVKFKVHNSQIHKKTELEVFTTRIDTIFGVTFVVAAPEIMREFTDLVPVARKAVVGKYIDGELKKSERERKQSTEKTGVDTGIEVINPANGEKVPLWVASYVMMDIGTGVVMGVPAHDGRDWEFAGKYGLPVRKAITGRQDGVVYEGSGEMISSGDFDGLSGTKAFGEVTAWLSARGAARRGATYHLRDWVFSRQHYWGEPIPMVYCKKCGWNPVPEDQLPVKLPEVEKYQPTGTGESPLAHIKSFVNTTCPVCGCKATRETDTMPNWAGSSWYFLRYCDPHNNRKLADYKILQYWMPVDWYNGGMEHTTLHLLYSRFWHKFLYDIGAVPTPEPYIRRTSHGVVLGSDGRKMSKSRGNVVNPDDIVRKYGADTLRMYEMFIGPFDQTVVWSDEAMEGVHRFLKRVWKLAGRLKHDCKTTTECKRRLSGLVKKVEEDIESMKFNTAVAAMMEYVNWWEGYAEEVSAEETEIFIKVLAPVAPFISEELYHNLPGKPKKRKSVHVQSWPEYDQRDINKGEKTIIVQIDGRVRGKIQSKSKSKDEIAELALQQENVKRYIAGKDYRIIFVPGKIISFVTK
jgi:leucyl-tRNA synthetase